ncbi:MAG: DUF1579 domain-containing protein [Bacteroidota bacterium]|nr:DUF1579 domain-containing protein [Ferruginibacter sp.]
MKQFKFIAVIALVCCVTNLAAQSEAEMKAWQTFMTPGEPHKLLATSAGNWTEKISMWMDPSAPPTLTTTTTKSEMIMGGRYLMATSKGEMMGMPFEGMSIMGYDNAKKVYTSTWIDNMGTAVISMEGTWDDATKSVNFKGKSLDPMTGKEMMMRQVIKIIDDDTQEFYMYDIKNGKETKTMEIKSTRNK